MKIVSRRRLCAALMLAVPLTLCLSTNIAGVRAGTTSSDKAKIVQLPPAMPVTLQIHMPEATPLNLPKPTKPLVPTPFGKGPKLHGWIIELPGNHPLCTPTYYNGKLYVGGGYGSYEFYAFDAATGNLAWQYHTDDDGPTAAVAEDGCVAFNSESCTVYVLDADSGQKLWQEWLGDPLMSQPAISKGRLFMAHPAGKRGAQSGHALLCADLKTGKHYWDQEIGSDVISSPVISGDCVYVTCMNGTSFCFNTMTGALIWKKQGTATSAPAVNGGRVIVSSRELHGEEMLEGVQRMDAKNGAVQDKELMAAGAAPYFGQVRLDSYGRAAGLQGATNGTIGPQDPVHRKVLLGY